MFLTNNRKVNITKSTSSHKLSKLQNETSPHCDGHSVSSTVSQGIGLVKDEYSYYFGSMLINYIKKWQNYARACRSWRPFFS